MVVLSQQLKSAFGLQAPTLSTPKAESRRLENIQEVVFREYPGIAGGKNGQKFCNMQQCHAKFSQLLPEWLK